MLSESKHGFCPLLSAGASMHDSLLLNRGSKNALMHVFGHGLDL